MKTVNNLALAVAVLAQAVALQAQEPADGNAADKVAIQKALENSCNGFVARDVDSTMAVYSPTLFSFDLSPPQHIDYAILRATNEKLIDSIASTPVCSYRDLYIKVYGDNAYARYILPYSGTLKSGKKLAIEARGTNIFEKIDGKWLIVHEHLSVPVDLMTGRAELTPPRAAGGAGK